MIRNGSQVKGAAVTVLGLTFKEDCPDLRNSRVIDVIRELQSYGVDVNVHDPIADYEEAVHEYGVELKTWEELPVCDAMVAAVAHREFKERRTPEFVAKMAPSAPFIDVKSAFDADEIRAAGPTVWRL